MSGTSASSGLCTSTVPPCWATAPTPAVPSSRAPLRMTAMTCEVCHWAALRKSTSTDGRCDIHEAGHERFPIAGVGGGQRPGPRENFRKDAVGIRWQMEHDEQGGV